ncbi:hypothetical protein [Tardiphaga sp.]|uniref:hypothetical protein n=1 Tax=Tardiphaga sp. TaxID=1926292 RepID=UPI0037D9E4A3
MKVFAPAIGSHSRGDGTMHSMRRVVCGFDQETFQVIRDRAVKENTSFAEQVRLLVEWGLEAK